MIATLGLLLVIFALARTKRATVSPAAVGAYIGAAYFFTSSTSFANPAISVGRMFSNTFAGIAPASVPGFVVAQLVGGVVAIVVLRPLYPDVTPEEAAEVVLPHPDGRQRDARPTTPATRRADRLSAIRRCSSSRSAAATPGISAALRARELDPSGEVTVVVADAYPNFSICGIPYYVSGEVTHWRNLAHRTLADLEATGMKLRLDTSRASIDPDAASSTLADAATATEHRSPTTR